MNWHPNGLLASVVQEGAVLHPEYRDDGVLTAVFLTPPEKGPRFSKWLRVGFDEPGSMTEVSDYSGSSIKIGYDKTGEMAVIQSNRGAVKLDRDESGKVRSVQTSWGYRQDYTYDPKNADLKQLRISQGSSAATVLFDQKLPTRTNFFDGGEMSISYYEEGANKSQIKEMRTPDDLVLSYTYDSNNRLSSANCGGIYELRYAYDLQGRLAKIEQLPADR